MNDWAESHRKLGDVRVFDYFKARSMPAFVEPLVTDLVAAFPTLDRSLQLRLLSETSQAHVHVLGWYARKLAGRAVRERSAQDVRAGLVALAISSGCSDARDLLSPLALLHNSAIRLGLEPKALFDDAGLLATDRARQVFAEFVGRPAEGKQIDVFGFSEGIGPHGFDYFPLLPEFGGPTPF